MNSTPLYLGLSLAGLAGCVYSLFVALRLKAKIIESATKASVGYSALHDPKAWRDQICKWDSSAQVFGAKASAGLEGLWARCDILPSLVNFGPINSMIERAFHLELSYDKVALSLFDERPILEREISCKKFPIGYAIARCLSVAEGIEVEHLLTARLQNDIPESLFIVCSAVTSSQELILKQAPVDHSRRKGRDAADHYFEAIYGSYIQVSGDTGRFNLYDYVDQACSAAISSLGLTALKKPLLLCTVKSMHQGHRELHVMVEVAKPSVDYLQSVHLLAMKIGSEGPDGVLSNKTKSAERILQSLLPLTSP